MKWFKKLLFLKSVSPSKDVESAPGHINNNIDVLSNTKELNEQLAIQLLDNTSESRTIIDYDSDHNSFTLTDVILEDYDIVHECDQWSKTESGSDSSSDETWSQYNQNGEDGDIESLSLNTVDYDENYNVSYFSSTSDEGEMFEFDEMHFASYDNFDDFVDVPLPQPNTRDNVAQYFGLSDYGDLIMCIDHVYEVKPKKLLMPGHYKGPRAIRGVEAKEKPAIKILIRISFRNLINKIINIFKGHPRNKSNTSGGPGESVRAYTVSLAEDKSSTFSQNIDHFITCTRESHENTPQVVMRNMRQFMSGMKNYLVKHGEADFQREVDRARSQLKQDEFLNLDTILESVMHQLVILPLREHLYGLFVDHYKRTDDLRLLADNITFAADKSPSDFGLPASMNVNPDPDVMKRFSLILWRLQEIELPLEKLDTLLRFVNSVCEWSKRCVPGEQMGADEFLPLLIYVVAKCGFIGAEIETEFMWGLLQPSLLSGETGYVLTAMSSAVQVLKNFRSIEGDNNHTIDNVKFESSSVLKVIIPDEYNGSLQTRTIPVRPKTTSKELCRIIAHKARITNPQDYALYILSSGEETIVSDQEYPQTMRYHTLRGQRFMFAYKRIDAKIAWPAF